MPPKKSKKAPAFYTDQASLAPFKVQVKDLIKTSLGLTASVVGIKHISKEGGGETGPGTLWVDYRGGYRSPIEKDGGQRQTSPSMSHVIGLMADRLVGVRRGNVLRDAQVTAMREAEHAFEKCFAPTQLWRTVHEFQQMVEVDDAMREKIQELNELFKLGLLEKDKKKK